mgnify:CR=1 FL=1
MERLKRSAAGFIEFSEELYILQTGSVYIGTKAADGHVESGADDKDQNKDDDADQVEARHGAQQVKDVGDNAAGKSQREDTRVGQHVRKVGCDVVKAHDALDWLHQDVLLRNHQMLQLHSMDVQV